MKNTINFILIFLASTVSIQAASIGSVDNLLLRYAKKTVDNIPSAKSSDDAVKLFSKKASEIIPSRELAHKSFDLSVQARRLDLPKTLIDDLKKLAPDDQRRFLRLAEDMKPIRDNPELGYRTIQLLDYDGLRLTKSYGEEVAEFTAKLGDRRFLGVTRKMGAGSVEFYKKYIKPHWGKWATATALTVYLSNPELFQDALGGLTEYGAKELSALGIRVASAPIEGAASAVVNTYNENPLRLFAAAISILVIITLLIGAVRKRILRWVFRVIKGPAFDGSISDSTKPTKAGVSSKHEPLPPSGSSDE